MRGILRRPRTPLDDHGQAGPGAILLLIAGVLTASLAAATFIGVVHHSNLQGARTSQDARERLAPRIHLESVVGVRPNETTDLTGLDIFVSLASEERPLSLFLLRVEAHDGEDLAHLVYVDGPASDTEFNATIVRDSGSAFDPFEGILTGGDSVRLTLNLTAASLVLAERDTLDLRLLPAEGQTADARISTPVNFGTALRVELY